MQIIGGWFCDRGMTNNISIAISFLFFFCTLYFPYNWSNSVLMLKGELQQFSLDVKKKTLYDDVL